MQTAAALIAELSAGRTSAVSLVKEALRRIHAEDAKIRSFVALAQDPEEQALLSDRRRAAGNAGLLEGIPVAVKDNIDVAGMATCNGAGLPGRIAGQDASVVGRLRKAGAVILGRLNMHEGALGATTDNPFHGRCDNPLAPGHTPGGSSGGSAAAVAAGFVPVSLGTDTMGSVRIPAAYCGLYGLKPTRGLVGRTGVVPLSFTLDTVGPLARCAGDIAVMLAAIAGHDPGDPQSIDCKARQQEAPELDGLRLAVADFSGTMLEPSVGMAFEGFLDGLRRAGASITKAAVKDWEPSRLRRAGLLVSEAEAAEIHGAEIEAEPHRFSDGFRAMLDYGRNCPGAGLVSSYRRLAETRPALLAALGDAHALVMPTAPQRPFPHGSAVPDNQADLTAIANAAGLPALAVPVPAPDGGVPCSVQLVGRAFDDFLLISLAGKMKDRGLAL